MLLDDGALERVTTAQVGRGLYILKYFSGATSGASPVAMVRPVAGAEPFIEVISAPGVVSGFLSSPGEAVVVRAERPGELLVKLIRQSGAASFDASFRLELIFAGESLRSPAPSHTADTLGNFVGADSEARLRLCGHVARRGDVEVSAGQWVAGPGAPAAIEGVEIRGELPAGVRIEAQALVATNPPRWLDWVSAGAFAGTRGRAMPLAGLRLKLAGDGAARFVLRADALFLGASIVSKRGREIELIGTGAVDPLVGLRLDLKSATAVVGNNDPLLSGRATYGVATESETTSRVRVFRAAPRS